MNRQAFLILFLFFITSNFLTNAQKINLGLLVIDESHAEEDEVKAAYNFLKSNEDIIVHTLFFQKITKPEDVRDMDIIWFHHNDSVFTTSDQHTLSILNQYLEEGGHVLLTLEAFRLIHELGIEPNPPEIRHKKAIDQGYGRKLGLHAFLNHPVFNGLNGGSYIFKPLTDTTVRVHGYFEEYRPLNGAVIAVDWDYIFIRENTKLVLEYWKGKGKLLAIGGYTILSQPNYNRAHLELFLQNCFNYLIPSNVGLPVHYWQYHSQMVIPAYSEYPENIERKSNEWNIKKSDLFIQLDTATNNFWDVTGERIAVMGKEKGGIDEIWAHPFMAFRDYQVGLRIKGNDSITWLNNAIPSIEIRPESFMRHYNLSEMELSEIITVSHDDPVGVVHYQYSGTQSADMFIKFTSNMRLMWPYSEKVIKTLEFTHDAYLNAILISAESDNMAGLIGSNKEPAYVNAGQYEDFIIGCYESDDGKSYCSFKEIASDDFKVTGIFHFKVNPEEQFDMLISTDYSTGNQSARSQSILNYIHAINKTDSIYEKSREYTDQLMNEYLVITTPDETFNEGYKWALLATDRFLVNTPGLGSSLVAGYSTTNTGWNGGHKIDGRPGYAWYFGRDGQWSGFAILDYGDFDKVRSILEMYIKFQDLDGKIYHEISTSGVVHYDAADATPLFIILAGKFLEHTGDLEFIKSNWSTIKKSIDFCFSTDTDNDHLIENTNVGHGWVEGGHLFGSHSSLYLTSCWAEALKKAGYMASALGLNELSVFYNYEADSVIHILNTDFWNPETEFLYQGKFIDNTYHPERTILTAIPIYFQQIEQLRSHKMTQVYAENNFSSDWGCRIVSADSPDFNPRGYHSGSVWPLFTGWAALAEYGQGKDVQGFTHIMNNLVVYRHWGLGFIEEVLNGETYEPAGVCRHQCWSETMVIQPTIEGMLGFKPDAFNNSFRLSPKFPANWNTTEVKNIKVGEHVIDFKMERKDDIISYHFQHSGPTEIDLVFDPNFPFNTEIKQLAIIQNSTQLFTDIHKSTQISLKDELILQYVIEKGIKVIPKIYHPQPGDRSSGMRIINDRMNGNTHSILLEAAQASTHIVQVYINDGQIKNIKNGELINKNGTIYDFAVNFGKSDQAYVKQELIIQLK
jgi:glycogen debranching enzyme